METMAHAVTFIHTSDLQIGMTRSFLPAEAQSRFDDSRLRAVEKLGALATEHGAEFIVVAGDVFEHNALERATLGRALEALRKLPVPVYLLPGNHDPLVADSIFASTEGIEGVTVLGSSEPIQVREGVEIVAAPLMTKYPSEDLCARAIRDLKPSENIRILVGHGQVEGYGKEETAALINLPCLEAALDNGTIDYVALGDTHSSQSLGVSGRVWFSGSPETTDFLERESGGGEADSGNALVVGVEKQGLSSDVRVEKAPTGAWAFEARAWEVADAADVEQLIADLREYPNKDRTVVKYAITGTLGLEANATLQRELAALEPVFAALYERERLADLRLAPSDEELENVPLSGYAREAMHELVQRSATGADPAARDAVNLLFRLSTEV
ncbi:exonuclease SbcCD subunit D [Corynebacterium sp. TA-R-1]|uniref:Nuclease SbcCD subunit D n=1 Tax=Corynebacterium stercoris TaxID=2943490 RepID=A0ABT1G015_9CORY|nr:exonuclease SbcCD subunit D [Corynebacterium stercoris]MCP1387353.1 exonuclease SbcCD subunit D [Corynebacterium stercoris]